MPPLFCTIHTHTIPSQLTPHSLKMASHSHPHILTPSPSPHPLTCPWTTFIDYTPLPNTHSNWLLGEKQACLDRPFCSDPDGLASWVWWVYKLFVFHLPCGGLPAEEEVNGGALRKGPLVCYHFSDRIDQEHQMCVMVAHNRHLHFLVLQFSLSGCTVLVNYIHSCM